MFGTIFKAIAGSMVDSIIGPFLELAKAYLGKQISMEELRARMVTTLVTSAADVEKTHSQELTKTYTAFIDAASKAPLIRAMWAIALGSQIWVLFWSQWVVPMLFAYGYMDRGWKAGTTGEWSYLLVGALLGLGPMVLRSGPAAIDTDKWKALIGK